MLAPEEIIQINGPTVDIYQSDLEAEVKFSSGVIYSVQLTNGLIITSPEKFPTDPGTARVNR